MTKSQKELGLALLAFAALLVVFVLAVNYIPALLLIGLGALCIPAFMFLIPHENPMKVFDLMDENTLSEETRKLEEAGDLVIKEQKDESGNQS